MSKYCQIIKVNVSAISILWYETLMLNNIKIIPTGDVVEDNIRIESFLLHARNLIDFLEDEGHLKCSEFQDRNGKKIHRVKVVPKNVMQKINEHLSHISIKRKTRKIAWHLPALRKRINQELDCFLDKISPKYFPSKEGIGREDFNKIVKN